MNLVLSFVSFLVGCLASGVVIGATCHRLLQRLTAARELESTAAELEKRRVATDSGRTHLPRARAGDPAKIMDGMPSRRKGLS